MAQLVARLNGIQKAEGSNPFNSTTKNRRLACGSFRLFKTNAPLDENVTVKVNYARQEYNRKIFSRFL